MILFLEQDFTKSVIGLHIVENSFNWKHISSWKGWKEKKNGKVFATCRPCGLCVLKSKIFVLTKIISFFSGIGPNVKLFITLRLYCNFHYVMLSSYIRLYCNCFKVELRETITASPGLRKLEDVSSPVNAMEQLVSVVVLLTQGSSDTLSIVV